MQYDTKPSFSLCFFLSLFLPFFFFSYCFISCSLACLLIFLFLFSFLALRDPRIQLHKSTPTELSITISNVQLSDDGEYTCSIFTMPVRIARATVTVLGMFFFFACAHVCVCTLSVYFICQPKAVSGAEDVVNSIIKSLLGLMCLSVVCQSIFILIVSLFCLVLCPSISYYGMSHFSPST